MTTRTFFEEARQSFHSALTSNVLLINEQGVPSNADKHSKPSVAIAQEIIERIGAGKVGARLSSQASGVKFEEICKFFLEQTFKALHHMRPGSWAVKQGSGAIAQFDQYEHLAALTNLAKKNPELSAALGSDYLIKPDVVIVRYPEKDGVINEKENLVHDQEARLTSLRKINNPTPILHASVSCKWTIRSDRAQNARSEGLNLVRNRKGRLPHVMVVTGEPTPNRIASIALGTGDIDCVYHFALPELLESVKKLNYSDAEEMLHTMISGKRLRDISDLPLDLVI